MQKKSRKPNWLVRGVVGISVMGAISFAWVSRASTSSPLPFGGNAVLPVVVFLFDTTGSMTGCDAGTVQPIGGAPGVTNLIPIKGAPTGAFLYDPRFAYGMNAGTWQSQVVGNCPGTDNVNNPTYHYRGVGNDGGVVNVLSDRYCNPTADAAIPAGGYCTVNNRPFLISRMEMLKISMAAILDANGDGVIDTTDEAVLKIEAGAFAFPDFTGTGSMSSNYGVYSANGIGGGNQCHPTMASCPGATGAGTAADPQVYGPGTHFISIWNFILSLSANNGTNTGSAIAGTRNFAIAPCYDGLSTTTCSLAASQLDGSANDINLSCRDYYIVVVTDGIPNQNFGGSPLGTCNCGAGSIGFDPLPISYDMANGLKVLGGEAAVPSFAGVPFNVHTVSIGIGNTVAVEGEARGSINCTTYWGGATVDANGDNDNNPQTMANQAGVESGLLNVQAFGNTGASNACSHMNGDGYPDTLNNFTDANGASSTALLPPNGNGYFATNVGQLVAAFKRLLNSIQQGTFSLSSPSENTQGGAAVGEFVYGAFFDVLNSPAYHGHLRKYEINLGFGGGGPSTNIPYSDCTAAGTPDLNPENCWDAGGHENYTTAPPPPFYNSAVDGIDYGNLTEETGEPMLFERDWKRRVVYAVNPTAINYNPSTVAQQTVGLSTLWTPLNNANPSLVNLVPLLDGGGVISSDGAINAGSTQMNPPYSTANATLVDLAQIANLSTTLNLTWTPGGGFGPEPQQMSDTLQNFLHAAGSPLVPFLGGELKCETVGCTQATYSPKLGDSFHSPVTVVPAPEGASTDPTYQTWLQTGLKVGAPAYDWQVANTEVFIPSVAGSIVPADPCTDNGASPYHGTYNPGPPATGCSVAHRRTVIYITSNDGMLHAIDDGTGVELWAFLPPFTMQTVATGETTSLMSGRVVSLDGAPMVADIKFPCDTAGGAQGWTTPNVVCGSPYAYPGAKAEDGFWHTMMIYGSGGGGNHYFAIDVTNPVKPIFMWDFHDPGNMGNTYARPAASELPSPNPPYHLQPEIAVWMTAGMLPTNPYPNQALVYTASPASGVILAQQAIEASNGEMTGTQTSPPNLAQGLIGEMAPVDSLNVGIHDRVYFGDAQGRMWKACNIGSAGTFNRPIMWFDPAMYNNAAALGQDCGATYVGGIAGAGTGTNGGPGMLTCAGGNVYDRATLRGPIYDAPSVTHSSLNGGSLIVAWGSGDQQGVNDAGASPLVEPESEYYGNFLWAIEDKINSIGCDPPVANPCSTLAAGSLAAVTGTATQFVGYTSYTAPSGGLYSGTTFNHVFQLNQILTGDTAVENGYLLFTEFNPNTNYVSGTNVTACSQPSLSILAAVNVQGCNSPAAGQGPLNTGINNIGFSNTLATGLIINPSTGTISTTKSVPTGGQEQQTGASKFATQPAYAGWRQVQ